MVLKTWSKMMAVILAISFVLSPAGTAFTQGDVTESGTEAPGGGDGQQEGSDPSVTESTYGEEPGAGFGVFSVGTEEIPIEAMPDGNLRAAILEHLDGVETLTYEDLSSLDALYLSSEGITSLEGIQYAENITSLNISFNQVSAIPDLTGLAKLENFTAESTLLDESALALLPPLSGSLNIGGTKIRDMQVVAEHVNRMNITSLTINSLNLGNEGLSVLISNLNAASKEQLRDVDIRFNGISDISALAPLTTLTTLRADYNSVDSIDVLGGLTGLTNLYLPNNSITDIDVLLDLPNLRALDIQGNPLDLNYGSNARQVIEALKQNSNLHPFYHDELPVDEAAPYWEHGIVYFTDATESSVTLVWDDGAYDNEGVVGYDIYRDGEYIDTTSGTTYTAEGLTEGQTYTFTIQARDAASNVSSNGPSIKVTALPIFEVEFEDPALEHAVRSYLELSSQESLTNALMSTITGLYLAGEGISSLSGLEFAVNLKWLDLESNDVTDVAPLAELYNLEELTLWDNQVTSIQPLENLGKLNYLDLDGNLVTDITPLRTMYDNGSFRHQDGQAGSPIIYLINNPIDLTSASPNRAVVLFLLEKGVGVVHDGLPDESKFGNAYLSSDRGYVPINGEFTVTVSAEEVFDLYGFSLELGYDKDAFEVVDIKPASDFAAGADGEPLIRSNLLDYGEHSNEDDNLRIFGTYLGQQSGIAAEGEKVGILDITFRAKTNYGTAQFTLLNEKLTFSDSFGVQYVVVEEVDPVTVVSQPDVPVTEVKIDTLGHFNLILNKNDSYGLYLMAYVFPYNATESEVVWESSNENVATIDEEGHVVPVGVGKTVITATAKYGDVSDSVDLYVYDADELLFTMNSAQENSILGIHEHLAVDVSIEDTGYVITEFEVSFATMESLLFPVSIVPSEELKDLLEGSLQIDVGHYGFVTSVKGTLKEGMAIPGGMHLFTVYSKPVYGGLWIDTESAEGPHEYYQGHYALGRGYILTSSGEFHGTAGLIDEGMISIANPDVDNHPGVGITDLVTVAKYHDVEVIEEIWVPIGEKEIPLYYLDFNGNGVIDMNDLSFVYMRVLFPNFDPFKPGPDAIPIPIDWEEYLPD